MSRSEEFGQGMSTVQQNAPKSFVQTSVLQPYMDSANGMAAGDASRRLIGGGMLPSQNGVSAATYEAERPMTNQLSATL
jgi:hypothetical protein